MRLLYLLPCFALAACGGTSLPSIDEILADPEVTQDLGAPLALVTQTQIAPTNGTQQPISVLQPTVPPAAQTPAVTGSTDPTFATLLNNIRVANQRGGVSYDARLDQAAQSYAEEMVAQRRLDHVGLDGSTPGTRATAVGYQWNYIAENIARGQQTETDVMNAWQGSSGHRANNLDPRAEDFGLGVAGTGSQKRWVLLLGREFD